MSKSGAGKGLKGGTPRRASKLKVDGLEGSVSPGGTTTIDVSVSRTGAATAGAKSTIKSKSKGRGESTAGSASEQKSNGGGDDGEDDEVRRWKEQLRREREQEDPRLRKAEEAAARAAAAESKFDEGKAQGGDENAAAYETAPSRSFKGDFDWNSADVAQQRGLAQANENLTRLLAAAEAKARRLTDENEALRAGATRVSRSMVSVLSE